MSDQFEQLPNNVIEALFNKQFDQLNVDEQRLTEHAIGQNDYSSFHKTIKLIQSNTKEDLQLDALKARVMLSYKSKITPSKKTFILNRYLRFAAVLMVILTCGFVIRYYSHVDSSLLPNVSGSDSDKQSQLVDSLNMQHKDTIRNEKNDSLLVDFNLPLQFINFSEKRFFQSLKCIYLLKDESLCLIASRQETLNS